MRLTKTQKLEALAARFYQGVEWVPKAGDLYTTSRADLEVYRVISGLMYQTHQAGCER
ncbi:hypothetical protein PVW47_14030 [Marinovum sp. SP66]|uniref:hypothetical protein n=1 Tax=Marinovum sp. SP66 TaxID=3028379 RepID=UPI00237B5B03|nr:hypothetical protein [Marinovum sp. SP66]MDD9740894.1 hypothetical protein [Marinovum sp. SP66]